MREAPLSPACDRKTDRCPPFQKAADLQRANRSCLTEGFPPYSKFLAKLLTGTPIDFYLCTAEIGIEVIHCVRCPLRLAARRIRRLELHRDMRIPAIAQLVREEAEEHQEIPVRQSVAEEEKCASQSTLDSMRD